MEAYPRRAGTTTARRPRSPAGVGRRGGTPVRLPFVLAVALVLAAPQLLGAVARAQDATPGASPAASPAAGGEFVGNVDIGGRTLNLECSGAGSPTVVLDAGLGEGVWVWSRVQPAVAAFARVCAYDRANVAAGFSDPAPGGPRTAADLAADLDALLVAAGVPGPVVLVGHGFGGSIALVFAGRFPAQVAGLVLVDAPPAAEDPLVPPQPDGTCCERGPFAQGENPERVDLLASEQQAAEAAVPPVPAVVVAQDPTGAPPGWMAYQENQAARLNAQLVVAEGAGHRIHELQPEAVVDAVRQVVEAVRDPANRATSAA